MQVTTNAHVVETNSQGEKASFGISDLSIVMDTLSKLYAYPVRTLVQEYVCNARDANREIGQTRRVQITAPTAESPTFRVRDFGPGLTPERMNKVFMQYGASTKRNNNKQTGGYGIGAKSGWAYTDSFVVESYSNGTKYVWLCYKCEEGALADLLEQSETDEENGVAISITSKPSDVTEFQKAIRRATMFWSASEAPTLFGLPDEEYKPITERLGLNTELRNTVPSYVATSQKLIVVADGVPYPVPEAMMNQVMGLEKLAKGMKGFVLWYLQTGEIEISRTREAIQDKPETRETLLRLAATAQQAVSTKVERTYSKCLTFKEMIEKHEHGNQFYSVPLKFKELTVKNGSLIGTAFGTTDYSKKTNRGNLKRYNWTATRPVAADRLPLDSVKKDNLYYNDGLLASAKITRRMNYESRQKAETLFLFPNTPELLDIAKGIGAKPVSLLPDPPKAQRRSYGGGYTRPKGQVTIHQPDGYGRKHPWSFIVTDVERDKEIVYAPFDYQVSREFERWCRERNVDFGYATVRNLASLKKLEEAIHIDEFIAKTKASMDIRDRWRRRAIAEVVAGDLESWAPFWLNFEDPILKILLKSRSGKSTSDIPPELRTEHDFTALKKLAKRALEQVKKKYPILVSIDLDDANLGKTARNDVIELVNYKYQKEKA